MANEESPVREDEVPAVAALLSWCFGTPRAEIEPWLRQTGLEHLNVERRAGAIAAAALTPPMGQFFGGRSVPMAGIASLGTSAEARGTGAAIALVTRILHQQRAKGFALSTLYPSTLSLYRKLGYERAGVRYEAKVPLSAIALRDRSLPLREMTAGDAPAVEACYRAKASRVNGFLDRGPYAWSRVREPRGVGVTRGFVVGDGAEIAGYAFVHQQRERSLHVALHATDLVATTPRAYQRLLAFAADHGATGTDLVWSAAPNDPSAQLLTRVGYESHLEAWMLRVLDVPAALTARGWPEHVSADMELEIADDVIAANAGRFTLHVEGGRAAVAPGGKGRVRIDVRALAALYSSWVDPQALAMTGGIEGPREDLAALATVFGGASPWMPDYF